MKISNYFLLIFSTFLLFSCIGKNTENHSADDLNLVLNDSITKENNIGASNEWKEYQDSLRNEILKQKDNKLLKNSFLQELYIRNAIEVSNDSLFFNIPFNLHGIDCGAPDCYSTDVSFNFKLGDSLVFPKKVQFEEFEHGCIDQSSQINGVFDLIEQTNEYIIYYSEKFKRALVLFSSNRGVGTTAFYYTDIDQNRLNQKEIYKDAISLRDDSDERDYPYLSFILTSNEYEHFIR